MKTALSRVLAMMWLFSAFADGQAAGNFALKHAFGPKHLEFTFSFEFISLDWSEGVNLDRIVVGLPAKRQTLRIDFSGGEFDPDRLHEATQFIDLNGDGFEDLLVPTYSSPMGNHGFFVWMYSPEDAEFVYCPELSAESNLEPRGNGIVEAYSRDGGPNRTSHIFQWTDKRFALVCIYRHEERNGTVFETQSSKRDGKWINDFARPLDAR